MFDVGGFNSDTCKKRNSYRPLWVFPNIPVIPLQLGVLQQLFQCYVCTNVQDSPIMLSCISPPQFMALGHINLLILTNFLRCYMQ